MILAAAGHAEHPSKQPPPPELELYWQCQSYGTLPETGGILNQHAGELRRMITCVNAYNTMMAWKRDPVHIDRDPERMRILGEIFRLRQEYRG
jgi:hypothetical protein